MAGRKLLLATCFLLFLQISSTPARPPPPGRPSSRCIPRERDALLAFKAGLTDPGNYLESWEGQDCCHWRGVWCSNRTSHVVELRLNSLSNGGFLPGIGFLGGEHEMNSSLLALQHLRCLDLSANDFRGAHIPEFIGGLKNLRRLDLSGASFGGLVPPSLGNLSKLLYLDLNSFSGSDARVSSVDLGWLSHLTALQYLDLTHVNLSTTVIDWAHVVNKLPSLVALNLRSCGLRLNSLSNGGFLPGIGFLGGEHEMNSSLLALQHLRFLDLSYNNFGGAHIPEFIGGLKNLRRLDLSGASFGGRIPPSLGNLSKLLYLDLNSVGPSQVYSSDLGWLSHLTALQYLDLTGMNLSAAIDWAHVVNKLPSLVTLNLRFCGLQNVIPSPLHPNLTSLENLDLSKNTFSSSLGTKNLFWYLPSLRQFNLRDSGLEGSIPQEVGNMTSIATLELSVNNLTGTIPTTFKNLQNLEHLNLLGNNINGPAEILLERLPGRSLGILELSENDLTGRLPDQLGHLSNLTSLGLRSNHLSGDIPLAIGGLHNLTDLSLGSNSLVGAITESHFAQLANLKDLDLSGNSLAMVVQENWVPPFKLDIAGLRSCKLGPKFPEWLRSQNSISILDISNTSIAGSIPHWFWVTFSRTQHMVLSHNQISGMLPLTIFHEMELETVDFSNNYLVGSIPKLPRKLLTLDLSRNNLSGPLPSDFGAPMLDTLILFKNSLSGRIPSSFCHLKKLKLVELSGNLLEGPFPNCGVQPRAGNSPSNHSSVLKLLIVLNLNSNNFSGAFPPPLQYSEKLCFLDLAYNQFDGNVPTWIGEKLLLLAFLSLRSNLFSGNIPQQLSSLKELQYLDLACNSMSGTIPVSLVKLMAMTLSPTDDDSPWDVINFEDEVNLVDLATYTDSSLVVTKGQELEYTTGIMYMVNMDFSCNSLTGHIPEEIGKLLALRSLNLSWNHLSGAIPDSIGGVHSLESLDLSHNEFSGEIPTSLSALTSLSCLNLSYNNLRGEIPSGSQLQTLSDQASIYIGNPGLCGPAVSKNCSGTKLTPASPEERQDGRNDVSFFLGMGIGYVMGLWVVFCTFLFRRKWRVYWFSLYDSLYDRVYVQVAMTWTSLTRKIGRG